MVKVKLDRSTINLFFMNGYYLSKYSSVLTDTVFVQTLIYMLINNLKISATLLIENVNRLNPRQAEHIISVLENEISLKTASNN